MRLMFFCFSLFSCVRPSIESRWNALCGGMLSGSDDLSTCQIVFRITSMSLYFGTNCQNHKTTNSIGFHGNRFCFFSKHQETLVQGHLLHRPQSSCATQPGRQFVLRQLAALTVRFEATRR